MLIDYQPVPEWEQELKIKFSQSAYPIWNVFCPAETSSTMDFVRQVYEKKPEILPVVVLAAKQNLGRGRQGSEWKSDANDFTASFGFYCDNPDCSAFSLIAAMAVNKILSGYGCKLKIKWPNDLITDDGRKISGILVEKHKHCINVGIGINLFGFPHERSASISEFTENIPEAPQIGWQLASLLYMYLKIYQAQGFGVFKDEYDIMALAQESKISVKTEQGLLTGVYKGVDEKGALQVLIDDKIRVLTSAEISPEAGE